MYSVFSMRNTVLLFGKANSSIRIKKMLHSMEESKSNEA